MSSDKETTKEKGEKKRDIADVEEDSSDSSDGEMVGPSISDAAPVKKKKVLEYEKVFLENLPNGENYEKSFMHRDVVTHVCVTPTDFIITASHDGHIKFWKKIEVGVEFVKHFRAHLSPISQLCVNVTGSLLCTVSADKAIKVFDVVNFDMINILQLGYVPSCVGWIHRAGDPVAELAVAEVEKNRIDIFDGKGSSTATKSLDKIHMKPISIIIYCAAFDIAISADEGGMIEFWSGHTNDYSFPRSVKFESKVDTDLYEFAKRKTVPVSMTLSPKNDMLATLGADRKIRIFRVLTGKMTCVIDESLQHYSELQQVSQILPAMEFGKKDVSRKRNFEA